MYINRADALQRGVGDKGYTIGWKLRYGFERGRLDEDLSFADAEKKAAELGAKDHDKVYWPEMIMDPKFQM